MPNNKVIEGGRSFPVLWSGRYENTLGGSNKFWTFEVWKEGAVFKVRIQWGRIGTTGQSLIKPFVSPTDVRLYIDEKLIEKSGRGYVFTSGGGDKKALVIAAAGALAGQLSKAAACEHPTVETRELKYPKDGWRIRICSDCDKEIGRECMHPRGRLVQGQKFRFNVDTGEEEQYRVTRCQQCNADLMEERIERPRRPMLMGFPIQTPVVADRPQSSIVVGKETPCQCCESRRRCLCDLWKMKGETLITCAAHGATFEVKAPVVEAKPRRRIKFEE